MNFVFSKLSVFFVCIASVFNSCSSTTPKESETVISGKTTILVDETFEPIIDDQLRIFESTYKHAEITLINATENKVFHLLLTDSARVAVVSRQLTEGEVSVFTSKNIIPKTQKFATDAVTLVTHKSNPDSVISVEEIIQILRGNIANSTSLVFDNPNSSTVRYLKELAGVDSLPSKGVYALSSNEAIIEHVFNNPKAIGVIGLNWLAQPSKEQEPLVEQLIALRVKDKLADNEAYKPTQSNLALGLYPLARDLYLINCQGSYGLGLGFSAFLAGERGQRLVLKSGLLPDSLPSREIIIRKQQTIN